MTTTQMERHLTNRLRQLSACLLKVEVHRSGDESGKLNDRLAAFTRNAAVDIIDYLADKGVRRVGVGWGYTVAVAIEMLHKRRVPKLAAEKSIIFVPTCGEPERPFKHANPSNLSNDQMSSTALASALDQVVNGGFDHHLSLIGVPDFVGIGASHAEVDNVKNLTVRRNMHWTKIFNDANGEIGKLDAILTSVASPKQRNRQFIRKFAVETGVKVSAVIKRVIADIGGVWIPRKKDDPVVAKWNDWWTGITLSHYEQCATRAASKSKPGVIVVAFGGNKSKVVIEVVKRGLVNTLVVDESLAIALLVRLGYSRPPYSLRQPSVLKNAVETLNDNKCTSSIAKGSSDSKAGHDQPDKSTRSHAFISYSHKDKKWRGELYKRLKPLIKNGTMKVWDDTRIEPGDKWLEDIQAALAAAKVAVLLVTPDFIDSHFITEVEFPLLLQAAEADGVTIFGIPISSSTYGETPIVNYQAAYFPDKPLDKLERPERNEAFVIICEKLKEAFSKPLPERGGDHAGEGVIQ